MKRLIKAARTVFLPTKLPIDDPLREKEIFEKRGSAAYVAYLTDKKGVTEVVLLHGALDARISEMYRLCYECQKKTTVIKDFVAFAPGIVFNSRWLADLVKKQTVFPYAGMGSERDRLLHALADGFRKASNPGPRIRRWSQAAKLEPARYIQRGFQREFSDLYRSTEWVDATPDYKTELVSGKVEDLIKRYPLLANSAEQIKTHLNKKHARKASVLIAHKLLGVPERYLQSKPAS